jgi:hypothetical protein
MWLRSLTKFPPDGSPASKKNRRRGRRRPPAGRLRLEPLDERIVLSFVGPTSYAVDSPVSLAAVNLTGDGVTDLAAVSTNLTSIKILAGNGDGTFQPAPDVPTGSIALSVLAGDVNGDKKADLVVAHRDNLTVHVGNGNGTFQSPQTVTLPAQFPPGYTGTDPLPQLVNSTAVGDLNADGKLDLVVGGQTVFSVLTGSGYYGNYYSTYINQYVNVLLGNGDGTFSLKQSTPADSPTTAIVLGDFTGDGRPDVATDRAGAYGDLVRVYPGNADGTLGAPVGTPPGTTPGTLVAGVPASDFDNDTKLDLLARDYSGRLFVLKGQGDGTFVPTPAFSAGTYPSSVAVGDLNGDGALDIAVPWTSTRFGSYGYYGGYDPVTTNHVNVLMGYGDGSFALPATSDLDSHPGYGSFTSAVLRDFNGDGRPDLAAADYYNGVLVARNAADWVVPASLTISDASVTEGDTGTVQMTFTVTLKHGGAQAVTVNYATADSSALAGSDYQATSGTLVFQPGQTTQTITVLIKGDLIDEPDQQFFVNLSGASGADLVDGQGVGTIVDNDPPPTLKISDASVTEGNRGTKVMTFTVTLTGATENWVSVNFATADGTATVANRDYLPTSGTLYFAPGETTKTISVVIQGDKTKEPNETFSVSLSGASGAVIDDGLGIGTIVNDDGGKAHNGQGNNQDAVHGKDRKCKT